MSYLVNSNIADNLTSALANAISTIKTELANLDETYKKMLAEAKASLEEQLEELNNQYHYWLVVRGDLPEETVEKKTRKPRAKKQVVEEAPIVEEPSVEEEAPVSPEVEAKEEPAEDEVVVDSLFEGNDASEETTEAPMEEFPEEPAEAEPEGEINLDEGWPEFPEEWK